MKIQLFGLVSIEVKNQLRINKRNKWFKDDYTRFKKLSGENSVFPIKDNYPRYYDKFLNSGVANGAYFHQDLFVARQIYIDSPKKHVDIGSRIDGFVAHVAVYRKIEVIDIRKLESKTENIIFKQADLMSDTFKVIDYCDSISCLHVLEHFGLGRYGDKLDPFGHIKGLNNISNMLIKGGLFYLSVPIGVQRIEFNAHRIFSLSYLINLLIGDFEIKSFSYIDDGGDFFENVELTETMINSTFNCNHGCGVFVLIKK